VVYRYEIVQQDSEKLASLLRPNGGCLHFGAGNQNASFPSVAMRKISEYEQYAEECRQLARSSTDPKYKATLEKMARAWETVAEERRKRLTEEGCPPSGR
jgi:hypothetical protein